MLFILLFSLLFWVIKYFNKICWKNVNPAYGMDHGKIYMCTFANILKYNNVTVQEYIV